MRIPGISGRLRHDLVTGTSQYKHSYGRKTDGGTRRSQRSGEEEATLVTVDFQAPHQSESTSRIWMLDFIG